MSYNDELMKRIQSIYKDIKREQLCCYVTNFEDNYLCPGCKYFDGCVSIYHKIGEKGRF